MILYERTTQILLSRRKCLTCFLHLHRHIEIAYVRSGSSTVNIDGTDWKLGPGQLSITFPHQIHKYDDEEPIDGYILIITPEEFGDFVNLFNFSRPICPIVNDDAAGTLCGIIENATRASESDSQYRDAAVKGYLMVLFSTLMPMFEFKEHEPSDMTVTQNILSYCDTNYMQDLSLDLLSEKTGVGKYYISKIFSAKIKISFTDYINTLRVQAAKAKLRRTDDTVTEIAESVGFGTVRSFNRKFVDITGTTPSEFRKKSRELVP